MAGFQQEGPRAAACPEGGRSTLCSPRLAARWPTVPLFPLGFGPYASFGQPAKMLPVRTSSAALSTATRGHGLGGQSPSSASFQPNSGVQPLPHDGLHPLVARTLGGVRFKKAWWKGGPKPKNKRVPQFIRVGESLYRVKEYTLLHRRFLGRDVTEHEKEGMKAKRKHLRKLYRAKEQKKARSNPPYVKKYTGSRPPPHERQQATGGRGPETYKLTWRT